jgi:hypothetical protein
MDVFILSRSKKMRLLKNSFTTARLRTAGLLIPAIFLIGFSLALGADFWLKKDYKEWTDKECLSLLTKSPWAEPYKVFGSGLGVSGAEGTGYIEFDVQLYSALPIRQAMAKLQKDEAKSKALLEADFSEKVIVNVNYSTNVSQAGLDLARYWQSANLASFQNSVFLIGSKGANVPASEYKVEQGSSRSFQFIFPRTRDGKELLSPEDKTLILQFNYQPVQGMGDGRGQIEFKVKNMVYNGKIAY